MEIALIISLIALAVALPGCIADSLTVIEKLRARRAKRLQKQSSLTNPSRILNTFRDFLKKVGSSGPTAEPLGLRAILKKSEPTHARPLRRPAYTLASPTCLDAIRSTIAHEITHATFPGFLKKI